MTATPDRAGRWLVDGRIVDADQTWTVEWVDRARGHAVFRRQGERLPVLVEGGPTAWVVTIHGRRIAVDAYGFREQLLARAAAAAGRTHRPTEIRATLPGLVMAVTVAVGEEVAEGDPLLTVEAMKMQNEIRATHGGTVVQVFVTPGQTVAAGAPLIRLADPDS